jgi:DNA-binding response OmpR family regulator
MSDSSMANAPTDPAVLGPTPIGEDRPRMDAETDSDQAGAPRLLFLGSSAAAKMLTSMLQRARDQGQTAWGLAAYTSQKSALQTIRLTPPQAIMAEVDGKPESRARFCEMVRYRLPTVPLFALGKTSSSAPPLWSGCLSLPPMPDALLALLAGVGYPNGEAVYERGPIRLNVATRTVTSINGQHHMTPKQCALLHLLMTRPDTVVSRSEIMQAIWETSYMEDTRTLDVHIRWLRVRIEPDPSNPVYLLTERGRGYRLNLT